MSADDTFVRTLLLIVALIVLVPFLMMAFAFPMMGAWGGGHMWNGGMWDGGMWGGTGATWAWFLTWLVFLLVILGIGYLLYRAIRQPVGGRSDAAMEELRIAYARGELSDEEFEERRDRLSRAE